MSASTSDSTDRSLPAWLWDDKAHVLRPRCPRCGERLMASGTRFTCLIVGSSHYESRIEEVVADTLERLTPADVRPAASRQRPAGS